MEGVVDEFVMWGGKVCYRVVFFVEKVFGVNFYLVDMDKEVDLSGFY